MDEPIPLLDLTLQYRALAADLLPQVEALLASGQYIGGGAVRRFEELFSQFLGGGDLETVGCNSGTDALVLALRALGIQAGDEVITTAFSFFASAEAIDLVGARPVFVDVDPCTFNLDPQLLEKSISPCTRAVVVVHLFGQAANLTEIVAIARRHGLAVIEDCAQAVGACWGGRPVGTWGDLGCFSFFPTKNLGAAGDGGAVVTRDAHLARQVRILKEHGQTHQYQHEYIGLNSRLDALQAVILSVKLSHLREWNWRRQGIAESYHRLLHGIPGLILPQVAVGGNSVWHQYTVRVPGSHPTDSRRRDAVQRQLQERGIASRVYYPIPLHLQPVYRKKLGYKPGDLPNAELCAAQVLSLPCFPELTLRQQERVAVAIAEILSEEP
ncbi:DegT/DnrJ/EryC1/StrS family aminotransferase [Synechococcus sp. H55.7]|uniref:DegT/DnrJ/EryC1/StrS family aminotransferase n=2 Tax=Synechococcus TaxID=1129 RepID=UPI0039C48DC3